MNKIIHNTTLSLLGITILSTLALSSISVSADTEVIDEVRLTVPVACTMAGTGTTHTATLSPGTYSGASGNEYENGIGKTTLTAICNDDNGFSIYAIGFTGNEYGVTNLIGQNTAGTIATKAYASGDTTSNWSMKLTKVDNPVSGDPVTYNPENLTISTGYNTWHAVPDTYTKVAEYHASTGSSTTDTTLGVKLETTYAAYIASNQAADTYIGQVKYTMVHPYDAAEPVLPGTIGVTYHANGSTFTDGATTNRVVYASSPMYIATTPLIGKSNNVANDGTKNTAYASDVNDLVPVTASGASKMKVVITYGVTSGTGLAIAEGNWDGQSMPDIIIAENENLSGTETYVFNGDTVTFNLIDFSGDAPITDYDYGFWAQVYPVYMAEQSGTEPSVEFISSLLVDEGTYAQTTDWYGSWYADINNQHYDFMNESELTTFLGDNLVTLSGTNIDLYHGLTFTEAYNRASKTQDGGYYKQQDLNNSICQTVAITQNQIVKDIRDSNTYMIGKLKDGKCWMLDNLALDPTNATTAANMNASNTNASAEAITNYLNGGSSMAGWSNVAVVNKTSGWNLNYPNEPLTQPYINNQSKNTLVTSYGSASISGQAKVGIYYNYCAVTVGTYCYETNTDIDIPDTNIDAPQDICPVNWRMPTGGANGEYAALYNKYNTTQDATNTASLQYALSTPLSGRFYNNSANYQNSEGFWWSSSYHYSGSVYLLETDPTNTDPYYDFSRYYGFTVRCLVGN